MSMYDELVQIVEAIDVSDWAVADIEVRGSNPHKWLQNPGAGDTTPVLFKPVTVHVDHVQGEDWAEVASYALATQLGVPAAEALLAIRDGQRGSLSRDIKIPKSEMGSGGVLISEIDSEYQGPDAEGKMPKNRVGHNLKNIKQVLDPCGPPPGFGQPGFSGFDVFAGYLVMDAWIANTDRHDENWAVHQMQDRSRLLAPSFDHGSALGFSLQDDDRLRRLDSLNDVERWARRGHAYRFENGAKLSLVEHALLALEMCQPEVREYWKMRLADVSLPRCREVIAAIATMSDPALRFAMEILDINRRRLLDVNRRQGVESEPSIQA